MGRYCERSPCDPLIQALGRWVFGDPKTGEYKLLVHRTNDAPQAVTILYCPFCGTRMDGLETVVSGPAIFLPEG